MLESLLVFKQFCLGRKY